MPARRSGRRHGRLSDDDGSSEASGGRGLARNTEPSPQARKWQNVIMVAAGIILVGLISTSFDSATPSHPLAESEGSLESPPGSTLQRAGAGGAAAAAAAPPAAPGTTRGSKAREPATEGPDLAQHQLRGFKAAEGAKKPAAAASPAHAAPASAASAPSAPAPAATTAATAPATAPTGCGSGKGRFVFPMPAQVEAVREAGRAFLLQQRDASEVEGEYPFRVHLPDTGACPDRRRFGGEGPEGWETCVTASTALTDCVVVSVGVGAGAAFGAEVAQKTSCHVVSLDPTPKAVKAMNEAAAERNAKHVFYPWGLNATTGDGSLQNAWTDNHLEGGLRFYSLADVMARLKVAHVSVLKLDVDGMEFHLLESVLDPSLGVEQILVRFHAHHTNVPGVPDKGATAAQNARVWLRAHEQLHRAGFTMFYASSGSYTQGVGGVQDFGYLRAPADGCESPPAVPATELYAAAPAAGSGGAAPSGCLWYVAPTDAEVAQFQQLGVDFLAHQRDPDKMSGSYPITTYPADVSLCPNRKRYGQGGDGGWETCLTEEAMSDACVVYAIGVGTDDAFDTAIARAHSNCQVVSLDPTPRSVAMMDGKKGRRAPNHTFRPWGLAKASGKGSLKNSWTAHKVMTGLQFYTLAEMMAQLKHDHVTVLKVDIEGFEFEALDGVLDPALGVEQILVEFHLNPKNMPGVPDKPTARQSSRVWIEAQEKLFKAGFKMYWSEKGRYHSNEGALQEYSFVRQRLPAGHCDSAAAAVTTDAAPAPVEEPAATSAVSEEAAADASASDAAAAPTDAAAPADAEEPGEAAASGDSAAEATAPAQCEWFRVPTPAQVSAFEKLGSDFLAHQRDPDETSGSYPITTYSADTSLCPNRKRYGPGDDGGWETCLTKGVTSEGCVVYGIGVGTDDRFDAAVAGAHSNCQVVSLDPTPWTVAMMDGKKGRRAPNHTFRPWGLAKASGKGSLKNSWTRHKVKSDLQFYTLAEMMAQLKHDHVTVLKVDIEGFEFEALDGVLDPALGVEQILVEFHFNPKNMPGVPDKPTARQSSRVWIEAQEKLFKAGFKMYWSEKGRYHGKAGGLQEYSFLRMAPTEAGAAADAWCETRRSELATGGR